MQDKILKIAESIFPDKNIRLMISLFSKGEEVYVGEKPMGYFHFPASQFNTEKRFNPYENDADAFKVLEALVARLIKTANARLQINDDGYLIVIHPDSDKTMFGLFDRGSICEAYLSLIQQEEG